MNQIFDTSLYWAGPSRGGETEERSSQKDEQVRKITDHYRALEKKNQSEPIRLEFLSEEIALLTVGHFYPPQI